jgi:hypothetical protein
MTIEWLRRHDPALDRHLRTYLFTTASILEIEAVADVADDDVAAATDVAGAAGDDSLGIGSLKGGGE